MPISVRSLSGAFSTTALRAPSFRPGGIAAGGWDAFPESVRAREGRGIGGRFGRGRPPIGAPGAVLGVLSRLGGTDGALEVLAGAGFVAGASIVVAIRWISVRESGAGGIAWISVRENGAGVGIVVCGGWFRGGAGHDARGGSGGAEGTP